jgi:hypothetical protein
MLMYLEKLVKYRFTKKLHNILTFLYRLIVIPGLTQIQTITSHL